jgi:hypothetical protein
MKKIKFLLTGVIVLTLFAGKTYAQTAAPNYFIGKWDVLVKGTPQGDVHLKFNIADSVGHLKGVLLDTTAAHKDIPVTNIEMATDKITIFFTTQSYDLSLTLAKKDDDHATGSLMGMFDALADRGKK